MNEELLVRLVRLVADQEGLSMAKSAKQLELSQSQLLRMLTVLGQDRSLAGLDWLEVRDGEPPRLYVTSTGRRWLDRR